MVLPSVSAEDAVAKFPKGFETLEVPSGRGYIRQTPQPNI
jgi:1-Cys peroxiredoxin 6